MKRVMKRFLVGIMSIVMLLGVTGCGTGTSTSQSGGNQTDAKGSEHSTEQVEQMQDSVIGVNKPIIYYMWGWDKQSCSCMHDEMDTDEDIIMWEIAYPEGKLPTQMIESSYDYQDTRYHEFEYDEYGRIIKESCKQDNRKNEIDEYEYSYNKQSQVERIVHRHIFVGEDDSDMQSFYEFDYDQNGNMIERRLLNVDKEVCEKKVYEYTGDGKISTITFYTRDDKLEHKLYYVYDEKGCLIKKSHYDDKNENHRYYEYKYDPQGRMISNHLYITGTRSDTGEVVWSSLGGYEFEYNNKGQVSKCQEIGYGWMSYDYNEDGTMKSESYFNVHGERMETITYTYEYTFEPGVQADAYYEAYQEVLDREGLSEWEDDYNKYVGFFYLDEDDIPEMFVVNTGHLYTYDGEVKQITSEEVGYLAGGRQGNLQYVPKKNLLASCNVGNNYYLSYKPDKLKTKCFLVCHYSGTQDNDYAGPLYMADGQRISEEEYLKKMENRGCNELIDVTIYPSLFDAYNALKN